MWVYIYVIYMSYYRDKFRKILSKITLDIKYTFICIENLELLNKLPLKFYVHTEVAGM